MTYIQGFVVPVPEGNKQAYLDMATDIAPFFAEFGASRTVECWEESVPDGKRTDLRRAVAAEPGEKIVFAWVWWPDKATCDTAAEKMMADERTQPPQDPPFDTKRMIFAGFDVAYDSGDGGTFGYVDAIVAPSPDDRAAYAANAAMLDAFFIREGAMRTVDGWGADVPDGKVTDFKRAVAAEAGEQIVFGWIEWPDKPTRDAAFAKVMQDPAMQAIKPAFDMQRAIFGGFVPILDTDHQ
ncbi:DUF1428 family protein [Sphingomonas sp.]|jgi:uncharacterized protein YbaA (DUF1428 family)|uniref:DUF1428 domain-containing protein n=1 Tax=Sphingomonas sp. TaxID=28214 RepID=UPI002E3793B7|nr:DUF1428 family protein [Sphingomonas sp.]HEX4693288.1 DUF1428 family protein [Sphingomonas sp.]